MIGIYRIRNRINGKIYVGSSKEIHMRWKHHVNSLNRGDHHSLHLQRSWKKYGETNFEFDVIEYTTEEMLVEREQHHLDTLKPWDRHVGYNIAPTAESPLGIKRSVETKQKLRDINLGKKRTEQEKHKISEGLKNSEVRKKLHASPEYREKLRQANLGEKNPMWGKTGPTGDDHHMTGRFGKLHHRAQQVGQYTKSGVLVKVWESISDAERGGFGHSNVVSCCRGRLQSAYGFVWKYAEDQA